MPHPPRQVVLALKTIATLDEQAADDLAERLWLAAEAGDSYGEWLWEWAKESGLDPDAIHDAGEAAARWAGVKRPTGAAPGVDCRVIDPCSCGHALTDHLATEAAPCDIAECPCDQFVPATGGERELRRLVARMTPEEVGAALGAGWLWSAGWRGSPDTWQRYPQGVPAPGMEVGRLVDEDGWGVRYTDGEGEVVFACNSPERAVAVAHLLVAAEAVAGGAEIGAPPMLSVDVHEGGLITHGSRNYHAAAARRLALDLLRAATEAEAQT